MNHIKSNQIIIICDDEKNSQCTHTRAAHEEHLFEDVVKINPTCVGNVDRCSLVVCFVPASTILQYQQGKY